MESSEETNTVELSQSELRKFYAMKREMAEYVLSLLRKTDLSEVEKNLVSSIGSLPLAVFQAPKISDEVIRELYENEAMKVLLIVKLASSDHTMFVRYLKENNPALLGEIRDAMPVVIPTEKCVCGTTPTVDEQGVHTCSNEDCIVKKLGFEGTQEQWNLLIAPHKYKKKEEPTPEPPAAEDTSSPVDQDLPF